MANSWIELYIVKTKMKKNYMKIKRKPKHIQYEAETYGNAILNNSLSETENDKSLLTKVSLLGKQCNYAKDIKCRAKSTSLKIVN